MNQRIWSALTATILTTTLGMATSSHAQQADVDRDLEDSPSATQEKQVPAEATRASAQPSVEPTEVVKVGEFQSKSATAKEEEVIAKIHTYDLGGRKAATLYVRSIPVMTFLGSRSIASSGTKMGEVGEGQGSAGEGYNQKVASGVSGHQNATSMPDELDETKQASGVSATRLTENDPVWKATAVAAKINQLNRNKVDANAIAIRWQQGCNCYNIEVNNENIVQIDQNTILPDTTNNLAEDALQITNRLRRLIGNAPPLREIADLPPPRPEAPRTEAPRTADFSVGPVRLRLTGVASWYGPGFHGRRSANGERYNQNAMTAAHRSLPFGTNVQVTNLNNGRSVVVRITDRGPFIRGRVIDLSAAAAKMLGMMNAGTAPVRIEVLNPSRGEVREGW